MWKLRISILVCSLLLTPFSLLATSNTDFRPATPEELQMKDVSFSPGAPAVILDWFRGKDDVKDSEEEYVRLKILTEQGKKYGDISISYAPGFSSIAWLDARTIRPDGAIVKFDGQVYDKLLLRYGSFRINARTFTLPSVEVGSILEYRFTRNSKANILTNTRWNVASDIPILHETLWLKQYVSSQFQSFFLYSGLPAGKVPTFVRDHHELTLEKVPAVEDEPLSPPKRQIQAWIDFFYSESTIDANSFWKKQSDSLAKTIESFIGDSRHVREVASKAVEGETNPEEKVKRLYDQVQAIENISFEKDQTEQEQQRSKRPENKSVEDVLARKSGSAEEITRAFVALARGAGFEASVIRVARRDKYFFSSQILDSSQLDGELAMVTVAGRQRFFDPGTPTAPFGIVNWQNTSSEGLQVRRKSPVAMFLEIPPASSNDWIVHRKADLHFDQDILTGHITITSRGGQALRERLDHWTDDEAATLKSEEKNLKELLPEGSVISRVTVTGMRKSSEPVVVECDVQLANFGSSVGSRSIFPLAIFSTRRTTALTAESRKNDIYFEFPYRIEDELTVDIPREYSIESMPAGRTIDLAPFAFNSSCTRDGSKLTYSSARAVDALLIGAESYGTVRSFFNKVKAAEETSLVLRRTGEPGKEAAK